MIVTHFVQPQSHEWCVIETTEYFARDDEYGRYKDDKKRIVAFEGSMADCEAFIRLREKGQVAAINHQDT